MLKTFFLLLLITFSEATIGVFVKLINGPGKITAMLFYPALGTKLPVMLWAACLGFVSTGFAYFGISIVLKKLRANLYALVDIIVSPVVAAFLGYLIFGEMPSENMIYGGGLLLGAGFWLSREMVRHSNFGFECRAGSLASQKMSRRKFRSNVEDP